MPELPEVEVVRRGLEDGVSGRRISSVEVNHPRAVRRHLAGADDFKAVLRGRTVEGARRRGKYLWLPLDSGDAVLAHLGMSGQLLVVPKEKPDERHLHVRVRFADDGLSCASSTSGRSAVCPSCSTARNSPIRSRTSLATRSTRT